LLAAQNVHGALLERRVTSGACQGQILDLLGEALVDAELIFRVGAALKAAVGRDIPHERSRSNYGQVAVVVARSYCSARASGSAGSSSAPASSSARANDDDTPNIAVSRDGRRRGIAACPQEDNQQS
jgi:hypothetical protein